MMKNLIFLIFFFNGCSVQSQNADSLWKIFNNKNTADTNRLNAINALAWKYNTSHPDSAIKIANQLFQFAKKTGHTKYQAKAFYTIGRAYSAKQNGNEAVRYFLRALNMNKAIENKSGLQIDYWALGDQYFFNADYKKSIEYYKLAILISKELKDKPYESFFYCNIGDVYLKFPDYPSALESYLVALKIAESINDSAEIQLSCRGLGSVYSDQLNFKKALEYYSRALNICLTINDTDGISSSYMHIASIYYHQKQYIKSEEYYLKKLKIDERIKDKNGISSCYIGLANVYSDQLKYDKALDYYLEALKLKENEGAKEGSIICYINTGDMYLVLSDYNKALAYQQKALELAKKINSLYYMGYAHEGLAKAYAKLGNYKDAYRHYVQFKALADTIFNKENSRQLSDLKVNFEVDKKESELKIKSDAEKEKLKTVAVQEKKQQQIVIVSIGGVLLIVLFFSFLLYKRFKLTNQQKGIIEIKSKETEIQKHLVEEKQKEIIDSITYAKRLQNAILPPGSFITSHLRDHFIYYQPKDIVAGDFYWAEKVNELFFIAVADSTGHGVPGAMVSIVCSNALDKAVKEFGITDTGKMLDKATDLVLETFARSGEEIKDGMDISLLCIDNKHQRIIWSGANNQLWYTMPGTGEKVHEIKADKQPIGKSDHRKPFSTHAIDYQKGATFYLMTDGYPDQFGGPKGKKYKYRQLEELISTVSGLSLKEQADRLHQSFTNWKNDLEQVDDVTIIGIRI